MPAVPYRPVPSSRWDRPPPPHDWRWVVGTLGKVLISIGLLMFGFVAYQLWGTGIEYRQAQDDLAGDFAALMAAAPSTTTPAATSTSTTTTVAAAPVGSAEVPATAPASTEPVPTVPDFSAGDVIARIEIPAIGVESYVVSGVQPGDLKRGPGHYPDTPMPGQLGNSAIAGHRTTYGEPFYSLDELEVGDEIVLTTVQGRFVYRMTDSEIVAPSQSDVIATTDPDAATLTLTTCHPRYTASERLIVGAELDLAASAEPQAPVVQTAEPATELAPTAPRATASPATTLPGATTTTSPDTPRAWTSRRTQDPPTPSRSGGSATRARSPRSRCGGSR